MRTSSARAIDIACARCPRARRRRQPRESSGGDLRRWRRATPRADAARRTGSRSRSRVRRRWRGPTRAPGRSRSNILGVPLLAEVEVAEHGVAGPHGNAEEATASAGGGAGSRPTSGARRGREHQGPAGRAPADRGCRAREARSRSGSRLVVDADGHELRQLPVGPDHAECPVAARPRAGRPVDDCLEHLGQAQAGPRGEHRLEEHPEAVGRQQGGARRSALQLGHELLEPEVRGAELLEVRIGSLMGLPPMMRSSESPMRSFQAVRHCPPGGSG